MAGRLIQKTAGGMATGFVVDLTSTPESEPQPPRQIAWQEPKFDSWKNAAQKQKAPRPACPAGSKVKQRQQSPHRG